MDDKKETRDYKEKEVKPKRQKKYQIINKHNYPVEIRIIAKYYRLEPRGKDGDTLEVEDDFIKNEDFIIQSDKVIVKEI